MGSWGQSFTTKMYLFQTTLGSLASPNRNSRELWSAYGLIKNPFTEYVSCLAGVSY